jgi:5-hydroxyisourate hydrolase
MSITTHILDTSIGRPAGGVDVRLDRQLPDGSWQPLGSGRTDDDGRLRTLVSAGDGPASGVCRLTFETSPYFERRGVTSFYPRVVIEFVVREAGAHHHVPLLISPFGYSTYRGS